MMHGVTRDYAFRLVEVVSTGVQIAIEAREVAARDFDTNAMARLEVIARDHRSKRDLVNFPRLHPHFRFVIPVTIAHALDRLVEVVSAAVGIDVD